MTSNILIKAGVLSALYWGMAGVFLSCKKEEPCTEQQIFKTYKCYKVRIQNNTYQYENERAVAYRKIEDDSATASNFGFSLIFDVEKFSIYESPSITFFSKAYAGICKSYHMEITDKIKSLHIYTILDFNEQYPAGSLITKGFQYLDPQNSLLKEKQIKSIDSVLNNDDFYKIEEFSYGLVTPLFLIAKPSQAGVVQFKVELEFESGRQMSAYTQEQFLKK